MLNGPTDLLLLLHRSQSLLLSLQLPLPSPLCVSSELAGQVELSLRMPRYNMYLQPRVSVRLTCPVNPLLASLSLSPSPLLTFSVCLTTNLPIVLLN